MKRQITDREFYPAVWVTAAALLAAYLVWRYALDMPTVSTCWFWKNWHVYCPGCGGTRSLIALLRGDLLKAFYYHPALVVTACGLGAYMLSQSIWRLRSKRGWTMHYQSWWVPMIAILLVLNCLLRNVLLIGFGIAL